MSIDNSKFISLAEQYGTPLYVYDADYVRQRYQDLFKFIKWPKLRVLYAMKANFSTGILKVLKEEGAWLDTVSPGDVILAKKLGFDAKNMLYTANNLTEAEMHQVVETGVLLNIGSLSRLEKFAKAYPGSNVCLRFNPDVVDGGHAKIMTGGDLTKFGILLSDVDKVKEIVNQYNLTVVGIHEHTGSGLTKTDSVYQSMKNLLSIATPENFPHLEFVDFGGGFKVAYHPKEEAVDYHSFGAEITRIFSEFCESYGKQLYMYFEPGKYLVAESGTMLVEVNTVKDNNGRIIAGTNSGFPQLIRPMFYEAYHHIRNLTNLDGTVAKFDICGNICETGDTFATDRDLPEVREGDILAIENAGAYCYVMGGVYNLRPMPPEVMVKDGEAKLVRKGLSSEELISQILGEAEV
ncbi:MAG: diaminopimelate decarboxylase [Lentisphaeria bacterium]|nr:diaminopimelate decarboxylase [Lentisphaeria bacterium]